MEKSGFEAPLPQQSYELGQVPIQVEQPRVVTYPVHHHQVQVPSDYLGLSLFTCLCCCWPIGILALFQSAKVRDLSSRGDIARAQDASQNARKLNIVGIIWGILIIIAFAVYISVRISSGSCEKVGRNSYQC